MEFFRNNKKIIVGIIAFSFMVWTFGMAILVLVANKGG